MIRRLPLALLILLVAFNASPTVARSVPHSAGFAVLRAASVALKHQSVAAVVAWLRQQKDVDAAALGRDHHTLDIRFRGGQHAYVLSPLVSKSVPPWAFLCRGCREPSQLAWAQPGTTARAAVLEPFASELNLPPNAGDPEASALRSAGFQVDEAYDQQVSVATFAGLAQYSVVYMHAHTGVGQNGAGVVATGEPANGDPTVQPYVNDGSVVVVGVAGSNQLYYGITSTFVRRHLPPFAANSLLFINGCALLQSNEFWQALSSDGAGVLISWDNLSRTYDDYFSAAAFFNQMDQGMSVASALNSLYAAGYGTSSYNGQTARLGYLGNGSITLAAAASSGGSPPTNTPVPSSTATATSVPTPTTPPTSTPTATATEPPTPTSTPTEPALTAPSLTANVKPGAKQTIVESGLTSGSSVVFIVTFPNGDTMRGTGAVAQRAKVSPGQAQFSFVQPASKITRHNSRANVVVEVRDASGSKTASAGYNIGFGAIDVSVQPRQAAPGHFISIWVHTRARSKVTILVRLGPAIGKRISSTTGSRGWMLIRYRVPASARAGTKVVVRAETHLGARLDHSASTAHIS